MNKLKVALVGLGGVGQGYDFNQSDDSIILTHATAINCHSKFDLVAGVDIDLSNRQLFENKFSRPTYPNLSSLYEDYNPDIVSIAVPTGMHASVFHEAMKIPLRAVVLEKPVSNLIQDAEQINSIAKKNNCVVVVNYLRRFNPSLEKLKKMISQGKFGKIYKGTAWYTKGIVENGSHFIDLFQWLLGEFQDVKIISHGRKWDDRDPEPDLKIRFGITNMYLFSGMEENFSMGRFELVGTKGMAIFEDDKPIKVYLSQDDPVYKGYRSISQKDDIENPSDRNIWFTYDNLAQHLENGNTLQSSIETGISTLKVVEKIILQLDNS
jgi:predicted dehydrogenase